MYHLFSYRITRLLPPVALLGACLWAMFAISRLSPAWMPLLIEALPLAALSVTISIGYAARNADTKLPEAVIKAADQALYRAKEKGRNCLSS